MTRSKSRRGILMRDARHLVVFGFLNEVTERLPNEPTCELFCDRLHGRLG